MIPALNSQISFAVARSDFLNYSDSTHACFRKGEFIQVKCRGKDNSWSMVIRIKLLI